MNNAQRNVLSRLRFIAFLIVSVSAFICPISCRLNYTVKTWDGYCAQLLGEDLSKRYKAGGIGFDFEAIRSDFIEIANARVVKALCEQYLDKAAPTDPVCAEMARLHLIGIWSEGNNFHIANTFQNFPFDISPTDIIEWADLYKSDFAIVRSGDRSKMEDDFRYCYLATINALFEKLVLHGAEEQTASIDLDFICKKEFPSSYK